MCLSLIANDNITHVKGNALHVFQRIEAIYAGSAPISGTHVAFQILFSSPNKVVRRFIYPGISIAIHIF